MRCAGIDEKCCTRRWLRVLVVTRVRIRDDTCLWHRRRCHKLMDDTVAFYRLLDDHDDVQCRERSTLNDVVSLLKLPRNSVS